MNIAFLNMFIRLMKTLLNSLFVRYEYSVQICSAGKFKFVMKQLYLHFL